MPQPKKYRRRRKLIKPRLQLKLVFTFAGISMLAFLLQYLLLARELTQFASRLPSGGDELMAGAPQMLTQVLLTSFGVLLPVIFTVGIFVTFRIAGPVYRFEQYLGQIQSGEAQTPCKLRDGDELNELCEVINAATKPLREANAKRAQAQLESGVHDPSDEETLGAAEETLRMQLPRKAG